MGTSNMRFYWSDSSPMIAAAKKTVKEGGNDIEAWWIFVKEFITAFWEGIKGMIEGGKQKLKGMVDKATEQSDSKAKEVSDKKEAEDKATNDKIKANQSWIDSNKNSTQDITKAKIVEIENENKKLREKLNGAEEDAENAVSGLLSPAATAAKAGGVMLDVMTDIIFEAANTILASTAYIHRFKIRGGIELMVGGKDSSTPWYLTIGNPYSPWLASNHIKVKSGNIETSMEMGYNDQPQCIKATFNCEFTRNLGKQELMRMLNNTFKRTYKDPVLNTSLLAPTAPKQVTFEDDYGSDSDSYAGSQRLSASEMQEAQDMLANQNKAAEIKKPKTSKASSNDHGGGKTIQVGTGSNARSVNLTDG